MIDDGAKAGGLAGEVDGYTDANSVHPDFSRSHKASESVAASGKSVLVGGEIVKADNVFEEFAVRTAESFQQGGPIGYRTKDGLVSVDVQDAIVAQLMVKSGITSPDQIKQVVGGLKAEAAHGGSVAPSLIRVADHIAEKAHITKKT
jgi:hypothetical protein